MSTQTTTETAQYKDLYSLIGSVPMILANNAEDHVECNESLWQAIREYNEEYYGNEPISKLIDYGFVSRYDDMQKLLDECPVDGITSKTPFELDHSVEDESNLYDEIMEWIEDQDYVDIYQTFITDDSGSELFSDYGYPTWYNEDMGLHFVGITHYGTAWSHIMNSQYPIKNHDCYLTNEALEAKWKSEYEAKAKGE